MLILVIDHGGTTLQLYITADCGLYIYLRTCVMILNLQPNKNRGFHGVLVLRFLC